MDNTKKNDRRISIVLNGKEKLYEELEKDKQAYEELLNEEITAAKEEESQPEQFEWVLSETPKQLSPKIVDLGERRKDKKKLAGPYWDDGKSEESPKLPKIKRKKKRRFEFKSLPLGFIGIVISAIIVGVSFGFMMLTIFTGEKSDQMITALPEQAISPVEVTKTRIPGQVPTLGVEVVQGGAFSLADKGEETVQVLQENGFAATLIKTTDPVFLFIGLGLDREQASVVAEKYKENDQEVYLKPYAITSTGTVQSEEQALFLETSVDLFEQLTLLSVNGLANGGSLLTEETMTELTINFEKLNAISNPFIENESQQTIAQTLKDNLKNAFEKIQSFSSSKNQAYLWQIQQYLLNGLVSYEELVKTF